MRNTPIVAIVAVLALSVHTASAQRLPPGVTPVHYDITVAPDLAAAKFTGEETIRIRLSRVVVDVAALNGDRALYEQYLARSRAATDPEEHYLYLYTLTSFTDPALIRRTLEFAVSDEVRSQDAKLVVARMLRNPDAHDLAWDLVRERWAEIQKKTGEFVGNTVIVGALSSFCDAGKADEIEKFFAAHRVPDATRTLKQSLETIRSCATFRQTQAPKLAGWLKNH